MCLRLVQQPAAWPRWKNRGSGLNSISVWGVGIHERTETMTVVSLEEPTGKEREGRGVMLRTRVDVEGSRWVGQTKAGVGVVSVRP